MYTVNEDLYLQSLQVIKEKEAKFSDETYIEKFISESERILNSRDIEKFNIFEFCVGILNASCDESLKNFALNLTKNILDEKSIKIVWKIIRNDENLRLKVPYLEFMMKMLKFDNVKGNLWVQIQQILENYQENSLFYQRKFEEVLLQFILKINQQGDKNFINEISLLKIKIWPEIFQQILKNEVCFIGDMSESFDVESKLWFWALKDQQKFQILFKNMLKNDEEIPALKSVFKHLEILPLKVEEVCNFILEMLHKDPGNTLTLLKISPKSLSLQDEIQTKLFEISANEEIDDWNLKISSLKLLNDKEKSSRNWNLCVNILSRRFLPLKVKIQILQQMTKFLPEQNCSVYELMQNLWHLSQSYDWILEDSFINLLQNVLDSCNELRKSDNLNCENTSSDCKVQIEQVAKIALNSKEPFIRAMSFKLYESMKKYPELQNLSLIEAIEKMSLESDDVVKRQILDFILIFEDLSAVNEDLGYLKVALRNEVDREVRIKILQFWEKIIDDHQNLDLISMGFVSAMESSMNHYEVGFTETLISLLKKFRRFSIKKDEPEAKKLKTDSMEEMENFNVKVENFIEKYSIFNEDQFCEVHLGLNSICQDIIHSVQPSNVIDGIDCF